MARTSAKDTARPTDYSDEIAQSLLDRMADGERLSAICEDATMPDLPTVSRWAVSSDLQEFADRLVRAREELACRFADKALELSEDYKNGSAHDRRLQIDTLKWYAAATYPEAFGRLAGTKQPRAGSAPDGSPAPRDDEGEVAGDCPAHLRHLVDGIAAEDIPDADKINGKSGAPFVEPERTSVEKL